MDVLILFALFQSNLSLDVRKGNRKYKTVGGIYFQVQRRNLDEQEERAWRSTGPKGEIQVSEVGSRSGKLNKHSYSSLTTQSHKPYILTTFDFIQ